MVLSPRSAASRARTLAGRPMTKATIVYGKTTTSRIGTIGHLTTSVGVLSLNSFMITYKLLLPCLLQNGQRCAPAFHHLTGHHKLFDLLVRRKHIHYIEHQLFENHSQSASADLAFASEASDDNQRVVGESQLDAFVLEELLILLDQCVLRASQYFHHRALIQLVKRAANRKPSDKLRYQAKLDQVLRLDLRERLAQSLLASAPDIRIEPERLLADSFLDDFFEPDKRASADEQNVRGVDREELLMWMLTPALRRDVGYCPFENLK